MEGGIAQTLASPTLGYADGHDFARGTKFRHGDHRRRVHRVGPEEGRSDRLGQVHRPRRPSRLGAHHRHDVTHDGKWILATTDTCPCSSTHALGMQSQATLRRL